MCIWVSAATIEFEPYDWQSVQPAPVIGVDEVGRGCLAGPVYAAAVILDPSKNLTLITDSKTISEKRREELFLRIMEDHQVGVGFATVEEIAQINILHASLLAMARAVEALKVNGGHLLVDGNQRVPQLRHLKQTTLIKGDLRATPIAAASIVAKVTRDRKCVELSKVFPQYGFHIHKGYGTPAHKEAIARYGPCLEHRLTFAGVKEYVVQIQRPTQSTTQSSRPV